MISCDDTTALCIHSIYASVYMMCMYRRERLIVGLSRTCMYILKTYTVNIIISENMIINIVVHIHIHTYIYISIYLKPQCILLSAQNIDDIEVGFSHTHTQLRSFWMEYPKLSQQDSPCCKSLH